MRHIGTMVITNGQIEISYQAYQSRDNANLEISDWPEELSHFSPTPYVIHKKAYSSDFGRLKITFRVRLLGFA